MQTDLAVDRGLHVLHGGLQLGREINRGNRSLLRLAVTHAAELNRTWLWRDVVTE